MNRRFQIVIAPHGDRNQPSATGPITRFGRFKTLLAGVGLAIVALAILIAALILGYVIAAIVCVAVLLLIAVVLVKSIFQRKRL